MDLDGFKVFVPIFHNCFNSNLMSFVLIYLVLFHYFLKLKQMTTIEIREITFSFFVLSSHRTLQYVYFECIFYVYLTLRCAVLFKC